MRSGTQPAAAASTSARPAARPSPAAQWQKGRPSSSPSPDRLARPAWPVLSIEPRRRCLKLISHFKAATPPVARTLKIEVCVSSSQAAYGILLECMLIMKLKASGSRLSWNDDAEVGAQRRRGIHGGVVRHSHVLCPPVRTQPSAYRWLRQGCQWKVGSRSDDDVGSSMSDFVTLPPILHSTSSVPACRVLGPR